MHATGDDDPVMSEVKDQTESKGRTPAMTCALRRKANDAVESDGALTSGPRGVSARSDG